MINVTVWGDFNKTVGFLTRLFKGEQFSDMDRYGQMGVDALTRDTPVNTGETAASWYYKIVGGDKNPGIEWHNHNLDTQGTPVVILIQYGHATGTGGHVIGNDFINPAMHEVFDTIAKAVWEKVNK